MYVGRRHDEDGILGRLFQSFEQRVKGLGGQHMGFVKHVDLVLPGGGRYHDPFAQFADVINTTIGGGVDLDDIERVACCDFVALQALITRFAITRVFTIDSLGEQTGGAGLAGATRSGKQVGMTEVAAFQSVFERADDLFLTNEVIKRL